MSREKLPIQLFVPRKIDEAKIEPGGNSTIPNWVLEGDLLIQRTKSLLKGLKKLRTLSEKDNLFSSSIPYVISANLCDEATSKSRRKEVSNIFQFDSNNVIGLIDKNRLLVKIEGETQFDQIIRRVEDFNSNAFGISCLMGFDKHTPIQTLDEAESNLKIKLINFHNESQNGQTVKLFKEILVKNEIPFKTIQYSKSITLYKIQNKDKIKIDALKNHCIINSIFSIEPIPKFRLSLDSLMEDSKIATKYPDSHENYKTLGILDSGVSSNTYLSPWIEGERWSVYPEGRIDSTHGTFVAGIALYGDECENQEWIQHKNFRIFDATIFPDTTKEDIEEDELVNNIQEVIKKYHSSVKIWNLSISIAREISDVKFSDFAIALDDIQDKYKILICKSAGNCTNFAFNKPKGRLHQGADSIRSLVVGSLAHKKCGYDKVPEFYPSPFSRLGPGPEYIIKPDISHFGGNAGIGENGKIIPNGVKSFSPSGEITKAAGTSFSTPRIAALATALYQELSGEFNPLFIKALIIHSANYFEKLEIPEDQRTKHMGFGLPKSSQEILYNTPNEATLIMTGTLYKGEMIDILDFPLPPCLIKNGYYSGQIIVTLVYHPLLDATQGIEYCQSNIDIKFGSYHEKTRRDINKRNILNPVGREGTKNLLNLNIYSKRKREENNGEFALKERLLIKYADKYYPVKKYAVDFSDLSDSNKDKFLKADRKWFLNMRGLFRDYTEKEAVQKDITLKQEYCLIITIKDTLNKTQVYDGVSQQLDNFQFWHTPIQIASEVPVRVGS